MAQAARPVIRNLEWIRLQDAKHGEAFDDVRNLIGTLQDQVATLQSQLAAVQNAK